MRQIKASVQLNPTNFEEIQTVSSKIVDPH